MARNIMSDSDLQKLLESDEFFEDLLVFDTASSSNQEKNTLDFTKKNADDTTEDETVRSTGIFPTLKFIDVTDETQIQKSDVLRPGRNGQSPGSEKSTSALTENNYIILNTSTTTCETIIQTFEPIIDIDENRQIAIKDVMTDEENFQDVTDIVTENNSTLDLKEWMVRNWISQASSNKLNDSNDIAMPNKSRLTVELKKGLEVLETFLDDLPKLESHYCRSSSKRLYLEPLFQTKTDVYRVYKDYCITNSAKELSLVHFKKQMKLKNIFIHKPKKDQCDICVGYKTKNVLIEDHEKHIKRKDEARKEKEADKKIAMENREIAVFTMDLQAVKLAPVLQASAIYYKTKLCVHNFTTFNLADKDVFCYIWHEAEGGLEANIFSTIITKHLLNFFEKNQQTKQIILYSDGCSYQNRNSTLSNALYHFANETGIIVIQKFLEKGHTQMEVDSVHSLIERKLKNKDIKLPSDYIEVCQKARLKQPFQVSFLDHTWFLDYSNLRYYNSIRPGQKKTDLHVNDIRCIKYEKNEGISFKCHYSDNWTLLSQRLRTIINPQISQLYGSRIKIKEQKYQHLQALKNVLPLDVHEFYDALPH